MDSKEKNLDVSVVIPIYNEEGNLDTLCRELTDALCTFKDGYEIIFVDDGSTDNSVAVLTEWRKKDSRIKVIRFTRNFGQHPAILAGLKYCSGEKVITMDGDLQNNPADIPRLLEKLDEGFDVISGYRNAREDSFFRTIPSKIVNKIFSLLSGVELKDYGCMFRSYRKVVVKRMVEFGESSVPPNAMANWLGARITEIDISHRGRSSGKSKYGLLKLLRVNFDIITGFSIVPIQIISLLGILISFSGFFMGAYLIVLRILYGKGVIGAMSLFALMSILLGLLLLSIGIIGEYIARIYIEIRRRPDYIIEEIHDS